MSEPTSRLEHLTVAGHADDRDFHRPGRGDQKIRAVEQRAHGTRLRVELTRAIAAADTERAAAEENGLVVEELKALGVILVLRAAVPEFPIDLDRLERFSSHRTEPRPRWLLLSARPTTEDEPEEAVVWVSDEFRAQFIRLFDDYLNLVTESGRPRNRELVANIGSIGRAVLRDLWQSAGEPPASGRVWWELWLARSDSGVALLRRFAETHGLRLAEQQRIDLPDRSVMLIEARPDHLEVLTLTSVPITEIRRPEFVDSIEDFPRDDQDVLTSDLLGRVTAAGMAAPTVCLLDSGAHRSHVLLAHSLDVADTHSVVDGHGTDRLGHGTRMAGLALYGPLEELLTSSAPINLAHRLESVKILPDPPGRNDPLTYGVVTAQGIAAAEAAHPSRRRAYSMSVTAPPEADAGVPSLWSAAVDALAVGTDIGQSDAGIALLGRPDPSASRLVIVSAGNIRDQDRQLDYLDQCDLSPVEDPAQAWNALTVGAFTDLTATPTDPSFAHWAPLAPAGEISPHSRTSVQFSHRRWPVKPDICLEGGNVLTDGADFHRDHPLLSVRTTSARDDLALGSANATSAATAQAARLAARAMAAYPSYWPETIRGLLVHAAEWTPTMRAQIDGACNRTARQAMLRRYGWGVPSEAAVLTSALNAVTLVVQDAFIPFQGKDHAARRFRLHRLPWPADALRDLGPADVRLRVTLSYFIEPSASRRGWRRRYSYASHGFRFELKAPQERAPDFIARINREAQDEESGGRPSGAHRRWLIGSNQRNLGSLHQDVWEGHGADLAECDLLSIYPVGGWWKNNKRADRADLPLRYSLILSLHTAAETADLYTPITLKLAVPVLGT